MSARRPGRAWGLALVAIAHAGVLGWAWAQSLAAAATGPRQSAVLMANLLAHAEPEPPPALARPLDALPLQPQAALPAPSVAVPELPPVDTPIVVAQPQAAAAPPAQTQPAQPTQANQVTQPAQLALASVSPHAPLPAAPRHTPADHVGCANVPHPVALRERGIEGLVQLRVQVGSDGRARQVQLLGSSGWRLFDEAALAKARSCRFRPAFEGETAVESWVEFPVRFALTQS